jgi:hypothetical protein
VAAAATSAAMRPAADVVEVMDPPYRIPPRGIEIVLDY